MTAKSSKNIGVFLKTARILDATFGKLDKWKKNGGGVLIYKKFVPCSVVTQRQQQTWNDKSTYTSLIFYCDETCLIMKSTVNNVYFAIFM